MIFLEWIFEEIGIELDLSYPDNLNSQNYKNTSKRENPKQFNNLDDEVNELFKLDNLLYEKANIKLDKELQKISDIEKKLFNFKIRCKNLKEINYKGKRKLYGQGPQAFHFME